MKSSPMLFEIPFGAKTISANFDAGSLSSDGGLLLLRQVDKNLGLTRRLAGCGRDGRDQGKVQLSIAEMLSQRVYGIASGYEDCDDHETLRFDPMLKLAVDRCPETGDDPLQDSRSAAGGVQLELFTKDKEVVILRFARNDYVRTLLLK